MKFDRHSNAGSNDLPQKFHVRKDPLVPHGSDAEVSLEERVQSVKKELHRGQKVVRGRAKSTSTEEAQGEAQRDENGVLAVVRHVIHR